MCVNVLMSTPVNVSADLCLHKVLHDTVLQYNCKYISNKFNMAQLAGFNNDQGSIQFPSITFCKQNLYDSFPGILVEFVDSNQPNSNHNIC